MQKPRFNIVTMMPGFFEYPFNHGVLSRGLKESLLQCRIYNPREQTEDVHQTLDDRPYGGGDGMVMLVDPLAKTLESIEEGAGHVVYLSPQGQPWHNDRAKTWVNKHPVTTLICGRYSGIDQRFINEYVDEEVSLGDFIISGGELAALAIVDSAARFIPGVLGNEVSSQEETFNNQLFEAPLFTRPQEVGGQIVPQVLLSGDHSKVDRFRRDCSLLTTFVKRPGAFPPALFSELLEALTRLEKLPANQLNACSYSPELLIKVREKISG